MDFHNYILFRHISIDYIYMTALEINADNAVLHEPLGHSVSRSPWGYHATTVGGKRKNNTKQHKRKQGGKSNKNKRRSRYTRQKHNKRTRKRIK
jgi:hypothetical protein